jgi:hypothetical protein
MDSLQRCIAFRPVNDPCGAAPYFPARVARLPSRPAVDHPERDSWYQSYGQLVEARARHAGDRSREFAGDCTAHVLEVHVDGWEGPGQRRCRGPLRQRRFRFDRCSSCRSELARSAERWDFPPSTTFRRHSRW